MIIIKIMGGLGNQMQQYALYEKFKYRNIEVKLDISWFREDINHQTNRKLELMKFPFIQLDYCTQAEKELLLSKNSMVQKMVSKFLSDKKIVYIEETMYDPKLLEFQTKYLEGYWACDLYYSDIMKRLQQMFRFPASSNFKNSKWIEKIKNENAVSIHIRRGDYLNSENSELFGNICTDQYYESAIARIKEKTESPRFYIFTDDINYVKEKYSDQEFTLVDWNQGEDSFYDMCLMSHCKHNICANSTFSMWGARLNQNKEKIIIRPLKHKNRVKINRGEIEKLWGSWVLIDENGV